MRKADIIDKDIVTAGTRQLIAHVAIKGGIVLGVDIIGTFTVYPLADIEEEVVPYLNAIAIIEMNTPAVVTTAGYFAVEQAMTYLNISAGLTFNVDALSGDAIIIQFECQPFDAHMRLPTADNIRAR